MSRCVSITRAIRSACPRSASSASFRFVMSRESPKVPTISPFSSRSGIFVTAAYVTRPSSHSSLWSLSSTGWADSMIASSSSRANCAFSALK